MTAHDLSGKVVMVTGAARGQGRSHAVRLAEAGADVILVDICEDIATNGYPLATSEDLARTAKEIEALGRRAATFQVDVRNRVELNAAVAEGVQALGRLDIVVANAGICPMGQDVPVSAFIDTIQVDFVGVVNAVEAALPHLGEGSSIIATGSVAGLMPGSVDNPANGAGGAGYSWAKRSIASFIHTLSRQLAPHSIRANAIHPTNVNTDMLHNDPMYRAFRPDLDAPTRDEVDVAFRSIQSLPIAYVEPGDVSNAVLFLASDEARYVTGLQLTVDGGAYAASGGPVLGS